MKVLVVLSGGQDSTTCLAAAVQRHGAGEVYAVTFDYGQRHSLEIKAAQTVVDLAGVSMHWRLVSLPNGILRGTSPLVNRQMQVEEYASAAALPGGLEKTFVPMRNQLFLTLAANHAAAIASSAGQERIDVITGLSQEDYGGYPDCRAGFLASLNDTIREALDDPGLPVVRVIAPLLNMTKKQTVEYSEGIPQARRLLAYSHTCYNGACPPCGKCHACLLREKGYAEAGIIDPLIERLAGATPA